MSKTDYPDYYESKLATSYCCPAVNVATVIATPMDLQTMLKKVKGKQYKSKREFQDDLELIWANCFQYNATEVRAWSLTRKGTRI